jgi:hypothetical protein
MRTSATNLSTYIVEKQKRNVSIGSTGEGFAIDEAYSLKKLIVGILSLSKLSGTDFRDRGRYEKAARYRKSIL